MTYQIFEIKYFKAQTTFFNHSGQYSQNALLKKKGERMSGWTDNFGPYNKDIQLNFSQSLIFQ